MTVPTSVHHLLDLKISPLETECSLDTAAAVDSSEGDPAVAASEETSLAADNVVPSNPESFVLDFAFPYLLSAFYISPFHAIERRQRNKLEFVELYHNPSAMVEFDDDFFLLGTRYK